MMNWIAPPDANAIDRRVFLTAIMAVCLIVAMIAAQLFGSLYIASSQKRIHVMGGNLQQLFIAQQALVDAGKAVEDYVETGSSGYFENYVTAGETLASQRDIIGELGEVMLPSGGRRSATAVSDRLERIWRQAMITARMGKREQARELLAASNTRSLIESIRRKVPDSLAATGVRVEAIHSSILGVGKLIFWFQIIAAVLIFAGMGFCAPAARREARNRRIAAAEAIRMRERVERLFEMTDMLQSAMGYPDANAVLRATADRMLPGFGGALYIFNNSRDRLDLSTTWNWPEEQPPPETVSPAHCWALKRGKPHMNCLGLGALRCEHQGTQIAVLEIPMMARGEVYGLLNVHAKGSDPQALLTEVTPLAASLADAMSLALSNIALREKLRTQALRDPLTGLYNRRYMEDVLERYVHLAERNGSAVSAIMIDLDHFKLLNDKHGHAVGDAVLREVAAAIVGSLRPSDVACRYGGEELIVLLPDCPLADAVGKAELLRARVEALSENHGTPITASFGVASMPEAAQGDLVAVADAALYRAKEEGRNRVVAAARRPSRAEGPILRAAAE